MPVFYPTIKYEHLGNSTAIHMYVCSCIDVSVCPSKKTCRLDFGFWILDFGYRTKFWTKRSPGTTGYLFFKQRVDHRPDSGYIPGTWCTRSGTQQTAVSWRTCTHGVWGHEGMRAWGQTINNRCLACRGDNIPYALARPSINSGGSPLAMGAQYLATRIRPVNLQDAKVWMNVLAAALALTRIRTYKYTVVFVLLLMIVLYGCCTYL